MGVTSSMQSKKTQTTDGPNADTQVVEKTEVKQESWIKKNMIWVIIAAAVIIAALVYYFAVYKKKGAAKKAGGEKGDAASIEAAPTSSPAKINISKSRS